MQLLLLALKLPKVQKKLLQSSWYVREVQSPEEVPVLDIRRPTVIVCDGL
jgi:hypothetical protein